MDAYLYIGEWRDGWRKQTAFNLTHYCAYLWPGLLSFILGEESNFVVSIAYAEEKISMFLKV